MPAARAEKSTSAVTRNTSGLKRGGPGRAAGVPNRVTKEAREIAGKLVDDPVYLESLKRRLMRGKLAPAVETMLWHYAKGKPKETIEHQGGLDLLARIERVVIDGSDTPD